MPDQAYESTDLKRARAGLARAVRLARGRPGVLGVDFGFIYRQGLRQDQQGIRFHVRHKRPLSALSAEQKLPEWLDAFPCDVIEASYSLHGSARDVCDPLRPGVSIGNLQRGTTGTMGLWARDRYTGASGLLSNWHVLCGSPDALAGERISQPGPHHLGSQPARIAALLERWIALDVGFDAAFARLSDGVGVEQALFDTTLTILGIEPPMIGMRVVKYGVTSGLTHGMIDGVEGSYEVDYSHYGDKPRWIDGLRVVVDPEEPEDEISLGGDSGAAWINPITGNAVALHFAGEDGLGPTAEYALAHPLGRILDLLDLDIGPF